MKSSNASAAKSPKSESLSGLGSIGKWKFPGPKFVTERQVLIKDTNVFGNVYFANHVLWQGEAREKLFLQHPGAGEFVKAHPDQAMATHSVFHRFVQDAYLGNQIRIEVTSKEIQKYSFMLVFQYFNLPGGEFVGEGWQKICFVNMTSKKPVAIPQILLDLLEPIQSLPDIK